MAEIQRRDSGEVYERVPLGIVVLDRNGYPVHCNPTLELFLGYSQAELQTMPFTAFTHPDDVPKGLELFKELLDGKLDSYCTEKRYVRKDGEVVWGRLNGLTIPQSGKPTQVVNIVENVTDDRSRQADRERLLHDLGERVKELTAVHGTACLLEDEGLSVSNVLERVALLLPPAFQFPAVTEARLTFNGMALATPGFRLTPWCLQVLLTTRQDQVLVLDVVYLEEKPQADEGPFLAEERNLVNSIAEMLRVSLDRRQIDRELRRSEARFHSLVDMTPAAVHACDPAGRITYQNRRSMELWGDLSAANVLARMYFPDGTRMPSDRSPMAEALRTGRAVYEQELVVERPDLLRIPVIANIAVERNGDGEVSGTINCFVDIADRKHAERSLAMAFQEIRTLKDRLFNENMALKEEMSRSAMFEEIVGSSPSLQSTLRLVAQVAPTDSTVLITGETGTGKELIARAIHKGSLRAGRAFVSVNCAAIPQALIASELFGHEKGAFTGAVQRRVGRFELAEGGTIFLDEVGEIPAETQVALLRVLQDRTFERVGGNRSIRSDVRVIAATNRDLHEAIAAGIFRSDLFYRLNVFPVEVAPLRERKEDIPLLLRYFVDRVARRVGKRIANMDEKTLAMLQTYHWPGNIRELQNVIERSVIVSETETFSVDERWLPKTSLTSSRQGHETLSTKSRIDVMKLIESALTETRGQVAGPFGAAARLGIPASTLESKIRSLGIDKRRFRRALHDAASQ